MNFQGVRIFIVINMANQIISTPSLFSALSFQQIVQSDLLASPNLSEGEEQRTAHAF